MKKLLLALIVLSSCTTHQIAKTPTKREIRKAMKYSTSEYAMPHIKYHDVYQTSYGNK